MTTARQTFLESYINAGFALIPIPSGSKAPRHKGWQYKQHAITTLDAALAIPENVGLAHRWSNPVTAALDVDSLEQARQAFTSNGLTLDHYLNDPNAAHIVSGREGRDKVLYRLPGAMGPLPTIKREGFELRCANDSGTTVQDVLPPSVHPDTERPYEWRGVMPENLPEMPPELVKWWQQILQNGSAQPPGVTPSIELDPATVTELRDALNAMRSDDRKLWVDMAHALHELGKVGRGLWLTWSQTSEKYEPRDAARVWDSCTGERTGYQSVFAEAQRGGWVNPRSKAAAGGAAPQHKSAEDQEAPSRPPPPLSSLVIGEDELTGARLTPRVIVRNYLYADVATLIAPGGTGKTTLLLYEMVHIVLQRPLWGLEVVSPGPCLLVTAEDRRETCIARLARIIDALGLGEDEIRRVRENLLIWDVTGEQVKLAETDRDIVLTGLADQIVSAYREALHFALITFDPMVSFGASEQKVNDNEQALITAARRIRRGLDCCVRYVHHTGQAAAREKSDDQYSGRGGSALADGARMVAVLQSWAPGDDTKRKLPVDCYVDPELDNVITLSRAKLSYGSRQPRLWVVRRGFEFSYYLERLEAPAQILTHNTETVETYLRDKQNAGNYLTKRAIEQDGHLEAMGLARKDFRAALLGLRETGRVVDAPLPSDLCHGRRTHYLAATGSGIAEPSHEQCADASGALEPENAENPDLTRPSTTAVSNAPPLKEMKERRVSAPVHFASALPTRRTMSAHCGALGAVDTASDEIDAFLARDSRPVSADDFVQCAGCRYVGDHAEQACEREHLRAVYGLTRCRDYAPDAGE